MYSIQWVDTFSYTGWWDDAGIERKAKEMEGYISTIGFFISETKEFYAFAMSKNEKDNFDSWAAPKWIPKGCVRKIKAIKA